MTPPSPAPWTRDATDGAREDLAAFVQVVYAAAAESEIPSRRLAGDYEETAQLRPYTKLCLSRHMPEHDVFLHAAIGLLGT